MLVLSSCGVWICVVSQYPEGYLAAKGKGNEEKNGVSVIDEEDEMEPKGKRKSGGKKKRKFIGRSDVRYVLYVSEMHPDRENNFFQFGWKSVRPNLILIVRFQSWSDILILTSHQDRT